MATEVTDQQVTRMAKARVAFKMHALVQREEERLRRDLGKT